MSILEQHNEPATPEQLEKLTKSYPRVPASFLQFLRQANGGYSPNAVVSLPDGTATSTLSFLGSGLDESMCNVVDWGDLEQEDLLPVVSDGGGNLFCLQMAKQDYGTVWFWDHDTREAEKCASSWDEFLARIRIER